MPPEDIVEGNATLDAIQKADEHDLEAKDYEAKKSEKGPEGAWVKRSRGRYEAGGRSVLKGIFAEQVVEKYRFTPTGDPEIDLIIAMGLRALNNELGFGDTFEPGEGTSSNLAGSAGGSWGDKVEAATEEGETAGEREEAVSRRLVRPSKLITILLDGRSERSLLPLLSSS